MKSFIFDGNNDKFNFSNDVKHNQNKKQYSKQYNNNKMIFIKIKFYTSEDSS